MESLRSSGGCFQLARNLAKTSTYGNFRHGAVLERNSAILGLGVNNEKYCSIGAKHRHPDKGMSTYHAEIACILGLPRNVTKGATVYVARASKGSHEDRMSRPCNMCHAVLQERGIKAVYYTVDDEHVGTYKF